MAKKLKKKHRPLSFLEWGETTGAIVTAVRTVDELEEDSQERLAAMARDEDCKRVAKAMSDAYHAYLCAFISNLLEKP